MPRRSTCTKARFAGAGGCSAVLPRAGARPGHAHGVRGCVSSPTAWASTAVATTTSARRLAGPASASGRWTTAATAAPVGRGCSSDVLGHSSPTWRRSACWRVPAQPTRAARPSCWATRWAAPSPPPTPSTIPARSTCWCCPAPALQPAPQRGGAGGGRRQAGVEGGAHAGRQRARRRRRSAATRPWWPPTRPTRSCTTARSRPVSARELLARAARFPAELPPLTVPVLRGARHRRRAGADRSSSREMVAVGSGPTDMTFIEHEGLHHEVLNEPEQDGVLDAIRPGWTSGCGPAPDGA